MDGVGGGYKLTLSNRSISFPLSLACLYQLVEHRSRRVSQPTLNSTFALLLQKSNSPCQRSSCTRRTGERIQLSARLLPDLGTSRQDVGLSVRRVVELVGPNGVLEGFSESLRLVVVVLGVVVGDSRNRSDVGAQHTQKINLFLTLSDGG